MENDGILTYKIIEQIFAIRDDGKYNMFNRIGVQREAYNLGYFELVLLIQDHAYIYCDFIWSNI